MKYCIQWNLDCIDETNASNCLNGINTAIGAIITGWENTNNKNINIKRLEPMSGKYRVCGIHRMSSESEKNTLINKIKGLGNSPFITGRVTSHLCSHLSWRCLDCQHTWDSKDLPPSLCPSCGSPERTIITNPDGSTETTIIIVSDAKPCVVEESWEF